MVPNSTAAGTGQRSVGAGVRATRQRGAVIALLEKLDGFRSAQELPCQVYRVDPSGKVEAIITDMACPNGLASSPDEALLYVADTGRMHSNDVGQDAWEEINLGVAGANCNEALFVGSSSFRVSR